MIKKITSSSIPETIISMTIILVSISVFTLVLISIISSNNNFNQLNIYSIAHNELSQPTRAYNFQDTVLYKNNYEIKKTISDHPAFMNSRILYVTVTSSSSNVVLRKVLHIEE